MTSSVESREELQLRLSDQLEANESLRRTLEKKDKKLSSTIRDNFNKVNQLLDKYKNNDGYKDYSAVTKEDRKALSDAVNSLGEPLSKMAVVTE